MRNFFNFFLVALSIQSFGQVGGNVLDGIYVRENARSRSPIPYVYESEGKLMWSKRVWRIIDLREKINQPFYYPLEPSRGMRNLTTIIRDGICSNELTAFDPISDEFVYTYRAEEACEIGAGVDTVFIPDENDIPQPTAIPIEFKIHNVLRYRIKEDWFFDNQRGVYEVRIIGFCPIEEVHDDNDEYKGERPLYWIYMPEIRHVLATEETYNRHNDVERRTYDDLFNLRFFSSYVYMDSNVHGRRIADYKIGLEALLEGRRIEKEMFDYEQDLWEY